MRVDDILDDFPQMTHRCEKANKKGLTGLEYISPATRFPWFWALSESVGKEIERSLAEKIRYKRRLIKLQFVPP